jgi:phosphoribosylglycinamide formyltransferase-1
MAAWLEEHGVDLVVCAGYMYLLRPGFLARFPDRVVNVHPALLPAFPGAHAVEEALAAGVEQTGASVHLVDEGVDTGPVLRQEPVAVLPGDTPETLHARIREVEHRLLPAVVRELIGA